ncbi:hypothetical protein HanRHA438_Chr08g0337971 [Helianthus annuus]|nr:hypothetical protein HanRHA438_Chr08g0337971 [Helianthus annuus]
MARLSPSSFSIDRSINTFRSSILFSFHLTLFGLKVNQGQQLEEESLFFLASSPPVGKLLEHQKLVLQQ